MLETLDRPNAKHLVIEQSQYPYEKMKFFNVETLFSEEFKNQIRRHIESSHKNFDIYLDSPDIWIRSVGLPIIFMEKLFGTSVDELNLHEGMTQKVKTILLSSQNSKNFIIYEAIAKKIWGNFMGDKPVEGTQALTSLVNTLEQEEPMLGIYEAAILREIFPEETKAIEDHDIAEKRKTSLKDRKFLYESNRLYEAANLRLLLPSHMDKIEVLESDLSEMYELLINQIQFSHERQQALSDAFCLKSLSSSQIYYDSEGLHMLPPRGKIEEKYSTQPIERNF